MLHEKEMMMQTREKRKEKNDEKFGASCFSIGARDEGKDICDGGLG